MNLRTAFIHMDRTEAIENYAKKKISAKITKLTEVPSGGNVTFLIEGNKHLVKLLLKDKWGDEITLKSSHKDMYLAINRLAGQLEKTLRRNKRKRLKKRTSDLGIEWQDQTIEAKLA